jgi:hypothetical protein
MPALALNFRRERMPMTPPSLTVLKFQCRLIMTSRPLRVFGQRSIVVQRCNGAEELNLSTAALPIKDIDKPRRIIGFPAKHPKIIGFKLARLRAPLL